MKSILLNIAFLVSIFKADAHLVVPEMFGDNMVLQQNSEIKIWGRSGKNRVIQLKTSWSNKTYRSRSDESGKWEILLSTPEGSFDPQTICITAKRSKIKIENILIGEVWLASGQSNMEMNFRGFKNQPIEGAKESIQGADPASGVRMLTVKRNLPDEPVDYNKGVWKEATPANVQHFSAVAYHFALKLSQDLNVPVGIINSSYGGSHIEGWLSKEILETHPDVDLARHIPDSTMWKKPFAMYNGMIAPYTSFVIKGFLWYQGESNVGRYHRYTDKLAQLAQFWRDEWGLGELPFYIVELPPYEKYGGITGALFREAQFNGVKQISNAHLVCTNDLIKDHELEIIHPSMKKPIGLRLAGLALEFTYQKKGTRSLSPRYDSHSISGDSIQVSFAHMDTLFALDVEYIGFEIAGSDRSFYPALVSLSKDKNSLLIYSSEVNDPVAVRYCFKNAQKGNIKNASGLPLIPFRTDNW